MRGNYDLNSIKAKLQEKFNKAEIVVQPNSRRGLNIKIVSNEFIGLSPLNRKKKLISIISENDIEYYELLTYEENNLYGVDLIDLINEEIPFWSNVVSLSKKEELNFVSEEDDIPEAPVIITFYSIKGGVGRTTALAYTTSLLEKRGYRVVTIDMDLEAPGLPEVIGINNTNLKKNGLVELLHDLSNDVDVDIRDYMLRTEDKEIYCLPAGIVGKEYIHQLSELNFQQYYRLENNPLHKVFALIKDTLNPDVILVDSRTGFSEISGPLLFNLSDMAIITFFPHPQSKAAFQLLTEGIIASKNNRGYTPEMRFLISPVPASDENEKYRRKGIEWIQEVGDIIRSNIIDDNEGEAFKPEEITSLIKYNEEIAYSDKTLNKDAILERYSAISDWIEKLLPPKFAENNVLAQIDRPTKESILESMRISTGQAEEQDNIEETFIKTRDYYKLLEPNTVLVVGRKGTGKTALFRMLREKKDSNALNIMSPSKLYTDTLYLDKNGFEYFEKVLNERQLSWSQFWSVYILLRIHFDKPDICNGALKDSLEALRLSPSNSKLVEMLETLILDPKSSFKILDELRLILDNNSEGNTYLLFDGLDTGFGSRPEDLRRRNQAITGLFELWHDWDGRFKNIKFKIFLRKDIWDKIIFQNQSHIWGRDIHLSWDQVNFIKTLAKQVLRSEQFTTYLKSIWKAFPQGPIEEWDSEEVWALLNILVGERMKGGNTTYTRNWIWNRLSDANQAHSPRYLFQLVNVAIKLEIDETKVDKNIYLRSLVRPRMLSSALPEVSTEAVRALREEYPELTDFMAFLKGKTSPIVEQEIEVFKEEIETSNDAGLLSRYTKDESQVRYAVPDLYLKGLGMTRKGQA
ncbi:AAA family ATPase [Paenibacillus ehimensis]|uniref:P-loop ATPase, Sll1717 family n=1 Tax=Paenibacillus ehimensis TaxID=79264 RepID=UPI000FDB262E|nr:AAA family ATPase [Paenibacillus ehimensis]MEC0207763.1 AAA family ATPase [Paenibacillus ehimensis]